MRSIRLSLVIYFLALLIGALGAVSWLVYATVERTLREKEISTVNEVEAEYQAKRKAREEDLDHRILNQVETLASMVKIAPAPAPLRKA